MFIQMQYLPLLRVDIAFFIFINICLCSYSMVFHTAQDIHNNFIQQIKLNEEVYEKIFYKNFKYFLKNTTF